MNNAIAAITTLLIVASSNSENTIAQKIKEMTGQRQARVVWCQQVLGAEADVDAVGQNLRLVGFDTNDQLGERVICGEVRNYHKPLFSSDGQKIIFSDLSVSKIYAVNWDGSNKHYLTDGIATEVWRDPSTGVEWIYLLANIDGLNHGGCPVYRCPLNNPAKKEIVWSKTEVSVDNFQLSADGRYAAGSFNWPSSGVADLLKQTLNICSSGCWASMAPDLSYRYWIFRNRHTYVEMHRVGYNDVKAVDFSNTPDLAGYQVYHPRWSNKANLFVLTGPYTKIADAGPNVEIYVGQFNANYDAVIRWQRVSFNNYRDFFPDLWVAE